MKQIKKIFPIDYNFIKRVDSIRVLSRICNDLIENQNILIKEIDNLKNEIK